MPLQIKVEECDAYVKAKFEDADAVDALRKAQIAIVKCEGGEPYSVADAEPRAPRDRAARRERR